MVHSLCMITKKVIMKKQIASNIPTQKKWVTEAWNDQVGKGDIQTAEPVRQNILKHWAPLERKQRKKEEEKIQSISISFDFISPFFLI